MTERDEECAAKLAQTSTDIYALLCKKGGAPSQTLEFQTQLRIGEHSYGARWAEVHQTDGPRHYVSHKIEICLLEPRHALIASLNVDYNPTHPRRLKAIGLVRVEISERDKNCHTQTKELDNILRTVAIELGLEKTFDAVELHERTSNGMLQNYERTITHEHTFGFR